MIALTRDARRLSALVAYTSISLLLAIQTGCHPKRSPEATPPARTDSVNFGYGAEPRRYSVGSVASASAQELSAQRVAHVEEVLRGKLAGVQVVTTRSGGFLLRIRGVATLFGSGVPLYVVDGMIVHVDPERGLDWLNPGDVARIDVLKDASSTAMYGMRGSNGVILITTKRGSRP